MKRWRRRRRSSLRRRDRDYHAAFVAVALAIVCATSVTACLASRGLPHRLRVHGKPVVLIIALPQMTWTDLISSDMPNVSGISLSAHAALMPVASPSDSDPNRTYVTLGAGRPAAGGEIIGSALQGGGFQVDIEAVEVANKRAHTTARPGLLGSLLRENGLTTALIAYRASDRPQVPPSAALVMDEDGHIDGGGLHSPARMAPTGNILDPSQTRAIVRDAISRYNLVLLDLTGVASPENADAVIGSVVETASNNYVDICLLIALTPSQPDKDHRTMGALAWTGSLLRTPYDNVITSASTRWPGVIVPSDITSSLLAYFELPQVGPPAMTGHKLEPAHSGRSLDRLDRLLTDQFVLEGTAARLYASYMMLLAAVTFALGAWKRTAMRMLAFPALVGVALPIGLLLCPVAGIGQTKQVVSACLASLVLGLLAFWRGAAYRPLGIMFLVGVSVTLADVLLGSPLMRLAPLGLGAVTGSRFYGIGNEYAGVVGAIAPIGLGLLVARLPRAGWFAAVLGVFVVLVIGAPWWGANWGGCVSVTAGLISVWVFGASEKRWRRGIVAIIIVLAAAALPALLDLLRPETERSHIGAAAAALASGRLDMVMETAIRKIEMNWRLARLASWWWVLAPVGLLGIWELIRRSKEMWLRAQVTPPMCAGFMGAVTTAIVALVANDSGVVMFGMALAVAFAAYVFLLARTEPHPRSPSPHAERGSFEATLADSGPDISEDAVAGT